MEQTSLEGSVAGTIYRNEENGFSVISVKHGRKETTATGILPVLAMGEQVRLEGTLVHHPQYGDQMKIETFEILKPSDLLGLERFLASGLIRGIKDATAKLIVKHFGMETLAVLDAEPQRLTEIKGIGKARAEMIAESYHDVIDLRTAMIFLSSYGIPSSLSARIARTYGSQTESMIRENPYRLCTEIEGIGFLTSDRIAIALGFAKDAPERIRAGILYTLNTQAMNSGHCFLPIEELVHASVDCLRVAQSLIMDALSALSASSEVICEAAGGGVRVYLPAFFKAEDEVTSMLSDLLSAVPARSPDRGRSRIAAFERAHGITFSDHQKDAILGALCHGVLLITGGPGTGKTTIIRCIISLLEKEGPVILCAPTGRAAKRMSEATGREAKTIHRLLEYAGETGFGRGQDDPLDAGCVIVDETSMVDILLMRSLLRAISAGTRLILVGDSDQLPSVGPGNVLGDLLDSGCLPSVRLTDIYRQSEKSRIVVNAHRINRGEMPFLNEKGSDFFFNRTENAQMAARTIVDLVARRLPGYIHCADGERAQTIQVLAPMKKSDAGVIALNRLLQEALNPPSPDRPSLEWGDTTFRVGDKVMQTRNNYDLHWCKEDNEEGDGIFNGDLGVITDIDGENRTMTVVFDEDKEVDLDLRSGDADNLDLAYAMSVHKSQGSEFPVVVIPVCGGPRMLMTRNLFYTALTRARELVVLVGSESVIRDMVSNNMIRRRYTALAECLRKRLPLLAEPPGGTAPGV